MYVVIFLYKEGYKYVYERGEMMNRFNIKGEIWTYDGPSAWHFITVAKDTSTDIRKLFGEMSPGFGSIPVLVSIGKTKWKTSIFFDSKANAYLLPVKADVRKKEKLTVGSLVELEIEVII